VQIKITVSDGANRRVVRVDGWLSDGAVDALRSTLASTPAPFSLLLEDLRGADGEGLTLLESLARQGTSLDGLSPYLQLLLSRSAS
jgi:hypothetical protein